MYQPSNCLVCGSNKLSPYIDLGEQPLANNYHKGEMELEKTPLGVSVCTRCFHSQLTTMADVHLMFDEYVYVSGTSQTLRDYFQGLCNEILYPYPAVQKKVLEIASNDGTLLQMFKDKGCKVLGVDPATNLKDMCMLKGLPIIDKYWSMEVAKTLREKYDIVVAVNVLPHVPDPVDFLKACKYALAPGGKVYIQTSQCDMFLNNEFDAIYHEHHSYFTVNSFRTLADRAGLRIVSAKKVPIHSMSFVFCLEPSNYPGEFLSCPTENHDASFIQLLDIDLENGACSRGTYKKFGENAAQIKEHLQQIQKVCKTEGVKMVGYGASAKGNTMMNYTGITLEYIVDDNPLKWGFLTPGTNIPIVSPDVLRDDPSERLAIVCLAWNFRDEILKKAQDRRPDKDDDYIFYVPKVEIWKPIKRG